MDFGSCYGFHGHPLAWATEVLLPSRKEWTAVCARFVTVALFPSWLGYAKADVPVPLSCHLHALSVFPQVKVPFLIDRANIIRITLFWLGFYVLSINFFPMYLNFSTSVPSIVKSTHTCTSSHQTVCHTSFSTKQYKISLKSAPKLVAPTLQNEKARLFGTPIHLHPFTVSWVRGDPVWSIQLF